MRPEYWDQLPLGESDRELYAKAGMGGRLGPGGRPAIAIVDMTRAFADDRFPLGSTAAGEPVTAAIRKLLDRVPAGVPVFYTKTFPTTHQSVKGLWKGAGGDVGDPLLASPEAHEIVDEIAPRAEDVVVEKAKPSAFWATGLIDMLVFHRIDTLIICGMSTSGCVRATAVDAFSHNLRVLVPVECVGDRGELSHRVNLFDIDMKYGDVLPVSEVIEYLESAGERGRE